MLQQVKTVPISLDIPAPMFKRLEERAREKNYRPAVYIRMLVDAAYAARCADERGDEPVDVELDHQVRQVFLLADCEAEFIASTLHIPQERVEQILEGWKIAVKNGLARPQSAPAPSPAAGSATPAAGDEAEGTDPVPPPWAGPRSAIAEGLAGRHDRHRRRDVGRQQIRRADRRRHRQDRWRGVGVHQQEPHPFPLSGAR